MPRDEKHISVDALPCDSLDDFARDLVRELIPGSTLSTSRTADLVRLAAAYLRQRDGLMKISLDAQDYCGRCAALGAVADEILGET